MYAERVAVASGVKRICRVSDVFGNGSIVMATLSDGVHLRLRLSYRRARQKSAKQPQVVTLAQLRAGHLCGHPHGGVAISEPEGGRHHPDDRVGSVVERDGLADEGGIAGQALPEVVAQHDNRCRTDRVLALLECSSDRGSHAEHVEQIGGHTKAPDRPMLVPGPEPETPPLKPGAARERLRVEIQEFTGRESLK